MQFSICFALNNTTYTNDAHKTEIVRKIVNNLPKKNTIRYTSVPRGIILSIAQSELFDKNSDKISSQGRVILNHIADVLNSIDNQCTIEAHTEEAIQIRNNVYKEDWEISIVRANRIADYFVNSLGVSANRIFPIGFGEIMPFKNTVDESTEFSNNRIDFVIFDYSATR